MAATEVCVCEAAFSAERELEALRSLAAKPGEIGAVVTFTGLVRDLNEGREVTSLFLEHYPGMTEQAMQDIVDEAKRRWPLLGVRVTRRVGLLQPTDPIVMVGVAARHRKDAFPACEFLMDYLKTRAPFWKKEVSGDGGRWLGARESDFAAAAAWQGGQDAGMDGERSGEKGESRVRAHKGRQS